MSRGMAVVEYRIIAIIERWKNDLFVIENETRISILLSGSAGFFQ